MSEIQAELKEEAPTTIAPVINNFCISVATVNGSGSQTSNATIMRALFEMGIPVSGKNLFPSNIQGLPTWYTIRINKDSFLARKDEVEIYIAMNPATFARDQADVQPGGVFFYDDSIKMAVTRTDITAYPMPVKKLSMDSGAPSELRDYVANMVYVGALAYIIGLDMEKIKSALTFHFKGKQKPIDLNYGVIQAAYQWAEKNYKKQDPFRVEPMNMTCDCVMTDGNSAAALGSLFGGLQFAAWYPITPASSLAETLMEYGPQFRKDPVTGKDTIAIVQAEDELAAAGMVVGAGWGGLRSMTSTSGPGLSLMAEYVGLAYFAEVPMVIWDVQRVGPATGMPTRTAQCDVTFAYFLSHGDTQHILLLPGSVTECFEFGWKALDLAEHLQTPVIVLSDLDFGMNQWITPKFKYPDRPMDRGKILWEADLERLQGQWKRYLDIDGDGIPYRTVMGNRHPAAAYFTRGTGHTEEAKYTEEPEIWERVLNRLKKKYETACDLVPTPAIYTQPGAEIGFIAFGSTDPAIQEARHLLEEQGFKTDYMQVKAVPFTSEVGDFIAAHKKNYVVELNRDGQMYQLLILAHPDKATRLVSLAHIDGLPLSAKWVVNAFTAKQEK